MYKFIVSIALLLIPCGLYALLPTEKAQEPVSAQVTVHARGPGCSVNLDDQRLGKTNDKGVLVLQEVEPGDHYLHLRCPNEEEKAFFISPRAGENVTLDGNKKVGASDSPSPPALSLAESRVQLRQLVQQAVQLRSRGNLDEAVKRLREAAKLDAENSDLHRELGITFLLGKDWKRARIEMLEAIRHDPTDADAFNGLGYALEKMGDLAGAIKQYRMANHLDPDDPTYRTHYYDLLSRLAQGESKKK